MNDIFCSLSARLGARRQAMKARLSDEFGGGLIEYGLLLALIAVVAIVAVAAFGDKLSTNYNSSANALP